MNEPNMLMRDPLAEPEAGMIAGGLGERAYALYLDFLAKIDAEGISLLPWKFFNDGKVWLAKGEYRWVSPRGANKAKPIFWLSIWKGYFEVSFHFAHAIPEEIAELPLSDKTMGSVRGNGEIKGNVTWKSIRIDVSTKAQLKDALLIATFRRDALK